MTYKEKEKLSKTLPGFSRNSMEIVREKTQYHEFAFVYPFSRETLDYCRYLKDLYGWQHFTFYEGKWRFRDPNIALLIKSRYPSVVIPDGIEVQVKKLDEEKKVDAEIAENAEKLKKAFESTIDIKGIKGTLYPYQKVAVEFFINNKGRAILADEMGTGKTLQSLAFLVHTKKQRSLVVCPASVKYGWSDEVEKWTRFKPFVVDSKTDFNDIPYDVNVVIINYDILKKHFNQLMKVKWDAMIVDEFHMIKSNTAIRTKAVKAIAKTVPSVLLLSGTPLLSRPIELFNGLQLMDPRVWDNWYDFTRRYCQGHQTRWGWEAKGASNIEELQQKISRYFLRRTKDEVLPHLPKKIFVDYAVDMGETHHREYKTAQDNFAKYLREYKNKKGPDIVRMVQAEKLTKINFLRQITTAGKMAAADELIENVIDSGQKVLVFSCFNEPIETLHKKYKNSSVLLTGKTPTEDRRDIIAKFQNDPEVKIFFGGIVAAGVGITLTAATTAIFLDYSWNPADHSQAIDRMHRPGATSESVTIYQLYSRNTIDEFMRKILVRKKKIFDALIEGGRLRKDGSIVDQFIDEIMQEYEETLDN